MPTDIEQLIPGGGVTAPERSVETVMKSLADDQVQRRLEHLLQCCDEFSRPLGYVGLQTSETSLEQERSSRCNASTQTRSLPHDDGYSRPEP
jgi:hypothetical protein